MNVIICVDNNNGLQFNHRRQSQDRIVRDYILTISKNSNLWMSKYSANQFRPNEVRPNYICNTFLSDCPQGSFCFVEGEPLKAYINKIEKLFVIKWNRNYPADTFLDINLMDTVWHCVSSIDFPGSSHEKITVEVYAK